MKKLLLCAAAALTFSPMLARTLSPEQALARVSSSSSTARAAALTQPKLVATGEFEGLTTYYVFSDGKKSMILGANDNCVPVIGYLDNPVDADTPMPSQLQWWLGKIGKAVKDAENQSVARLSLSGNGLANPFNLSSPIRVYNRPAPGVKTATKTDIAMLCQTKWDQGAPYNDQCPASGSSKSVTGCVATAMAQAMKYYNYPDVGKGTVSVTFNGKKQSMDLNSAPFDWTNMLNTYPSSATAAQKTAVSTLMKACGYAVDMNYSPQESGAMSQNIVAAMVNNFKYDQGLDYQMRDFYTDEQWIDMLYAELAAGRPVMYGGTGAGGGHQFICDGYRASDNYFHFNWGWSGSYDGMFSINALDPAGVGIGGGSGNFNEDQDALFGFQKPVSGSKKPASWICIYDGWLKGSASGRNVTLAGSGQYSGFYNMSGWGGNFDIGYILTNSSDKTTGYSIYTSQFLDKMRGFTSLNCAIPSSVADGTYKMAPAYRIAGTSTWVPVKMPVNYPQYITVDIKGSSITVTNYEPEPGDNPGGDTAEEWTLADFKTSTGFTAGANFDLTVTITNPNAESQTQPLCAAVFDPASMYIQNDYRNYVQNITLAAGESKTVTFLGALPADVTAGRYIVGIMNPSTMMLLDDAYVNVEGAEGSTTVSITAMSTNPATLVAGEAFTTTIKAKNTGSKTESIDVDLLFCIEDPDDPDYILIKGEAGSKKLTVPSGGTVRSYTANCTTPADLASGKYYLVAAYGNSILGMTEVTVVINQGVDSIAADLEDENVLYFDLQGRPVDKANLAPGLYIRQAGEKASKVIVK